MSVFTRYTSPYPPPLRFIGRIDECGGLPAGAADDLLGTAGGVRDEARDLLDRVAGGAQDQHLALARTERGEHPVGVDHRGVGRRGEELLGDRVAGLPLPSAPVRPAAVAHGTDEVALHVDDVVLLSQKREERLLGEVLGFFEGDAELPHGNPQQQRQQRLVPFFERHMPRSRTERVQSSRLYSC